MCTTELPDVPDDLPRSLNRLMDSASDEDAPLLAIAMAMAATFTGIQIEPEPGLLEPQSGTRSPPPSSAYRSCRRVYRDWYTQRGVGSSEVERR